MIADISGHILLARHFHIGHGRHQPGFYLFIFSLLTIWCLLVACMAIGLWGIFRKAGRPGWYAMVPGLNIVTLLEVAGQSVWMFILLFLPGVNIIAVMTLANDLGRSFGKRNTGFVMGLLFLPFIFLPVLAFGSSRYLGPGGKKPKEPLQGTGV